MAATPPIILSVTCTASMPRPAFDLIWQAQGGYTGPFAIAVFDLTGTAVAGAASGVGISGGGWQADDGAMTASGFYQVKVQAGADGPYSTAVTLLFNPAANLATVYDGAAVTLTWTPPPGPPAGQFLLFFQAGSYTQAIATENQTGVVFVPDPAQTPRDAAWSVSVTPTLAPATGPQSPAAAIINVAPLTSSIDVVSDSAGGVSFHAWCLSENMPDEPQFLVTLLTEGRTLAVSGPLAPDLATGGALRVPVEVSTPANAARDLRVTMALTSGGGSSVSRGPYGPSLPLLAWGPDCLSVETNPGSGPDQVSITGAFQPKPGTPGLTGIILLARTSDGELSGSYFERPGMIQTITLDQVERGADYKVAAAGMLGSCFGPMLDGPAILTSPPSLETVAWDGAILSATWGAVADPGATGYRLQLLSSAGGVVGEVSAAGLKAHLAAAPGAASVQVRQAGDRTLGPASAAAALITGAPTSLVAAWTALGDKGLMEWDPVEGAGAYEIEVWFGTRRVATMTAPAAEKPSAELPRGEVRGRGHFRVRATSAGDTAPKITGPWSEPGLIIAAIPKDVAVRYDGSLAHVAWDAVPGASSYQITVLEGTSVSHGPFVVTGTATAFALPYDATKTWTLVAQAADGFTKGPGSPPIPVFGPGWYLSASADQTAVKPANAQSMAAFDIVLDLPEIFASPQPTPPADATFVLTKTTGNFAYSLKIPSGSLAWTFGAGPIRADLRTAYLAFIAALEGATATPQGLATVQQAIGRAMPQTFAETLFYNYGLRAEQGCVDLKPGMMLRAEYETYQFLGGAAPDAAYLNGYVASASSEYQVASYGGSGGWLIGFDRFLAAIAAAGGLAVPTPSFSQRKMQGAGGVIDTFYTQFRKPFVRLVYPPSFQAQNSAGNPSPEYNAVLLAASRLDALETATANIRNGLEAGADVALLYFRGRTTLTAGVQVWLDGQPLSVPLGTTVGNLLERRAARPPALALPVSGVSLARANGAAVTGKPAALALDGGQPVHLDWTLTPSPAWLDLPLLHGDRLALG